MGVYLKKKKTTRLLIHFVRGSKQHSKEPSKGTSHTGRSREKADIHGFPDRLSGLWGKKQTFLKKETPTNAA